MNTVQIIASSLMPFKGTNAYPEGHAIEYLPVLAILHSPTRATPRLPLKPQTAEIEDVNTTSKCMEDTAM